MICDNCAFYNSAERKRRNGEDGDIAFWEIAFNDVGAPSTVSFGITEDSLRRCSNCGRESEELTKFCPECGKAMKIVDYGHPF